VEDKGVKESWGKSCNRVVALTFFKAEADDDLQSGSIVIVDAVGGADCGNNDEGGSSDNDEGGNGGCNRKEDGGESRD